ncbi:hypothetical protein [Absidia glauca]|uniref:Uncharacterized protein n=1 Tax=Absidia glauca TaxID=4829 RepID=A0A168PKS2_ABSGL|nr:hypothetical protein [Absidia glauca]
MVKISKKTGVYAERSLCHDTTRCHNSLRPDFLCSHTRGGVNREYLENPEAFAVAAPVAAAGADAGAAQEAAPAEEEESEDDDMGFGLFD